MLPRRRLCAEVFGGDRRYSPQVPETQPGGDAAALPEGAFNLVALTRNHIRP